MMEKMREAPEGRLPFILDARAGCRDQSRLGSRLFAFSPFFSFQAL